MRTRHTALLVLTILLGAALYVAARLHALDHLRHIRTEHARREHDRMHRRLESLIAGDDVLASAERQRGQMIVGMRREGIETLIRDVSHAYLNDVILDLPPLRIEKGGVVRKKTFLGEIEAGEWHAQLSVHDVKGRLQAATPQIHFIGQNRFGVKLRVNLEAGRATATLRFSWNARSVAGLVCRDFEVSEEIAGQVLSNESVVAGDFEVSLGAEALVVTPHVDRQPVFLVSVDLTPESWNRVRRLLEGQDTWLKCGLALDPEAVVAQLQELARHGFPVKFPRRLLRPMTFPSRLQQTVSIEDRTAALEVVLTSLEITPQAVWYGATWRVWPAMAPSTKDSGRSSSPAPQPVGPR